jgi:hypothetical protein
LAIPSDSATAIEAETIFMTCYFRHLQEIFKKSGIAVTAENKREVDRVIHTVVGVKYKDCSSTWREVKKRIAQDEEAFVSELKKALAANSQNAI